MFKKGVFSKTKTECSGMFYQCMLGQISNIMGDVNKFVAFVFNLPCGLILSQLAGSLENIYIWSIADIVRYICTLGSLWRKLQETCLR